MAYNRKHKTFFIKIINFKIWYFKRLIPQSYKSSFVILKHELNHASMPTSLIKHRVLCKNTFKNNYLGNHLACSTHGSSPDSQHLKPPSQQKHLTSSLRPKENKTNTEYTCSNT